MGVHDHQTAEEQALPQQADELTALPSVDDLGEYVAKAPEEELSNLLRLLHPADVADLLGEIDPEDHWPRVLELLPEPSLAHVLAEVEGGVEDDLIEYLSNERLAGLMSYMDSDDATDLLAHFPEKVRTRLVAALKRSEPEEGAAVERLLQYEEDTAGGIMQAELAAVRSSATVGEAIAVIRRLDPEDGEHLHRIYITDDTESLMGQVPLATLALTDDSVSIASVMQPAQFRVTPEVDQEEVAALFAKYDLVTLPVVDAQGRLLGRIVHDDIFDVLEAEADEDLMRMVGASEEDLVYSDRILKVSAMRLPWLAVTLLGTVATGVLISIFKGTLDEVLALTFFIPAIMGMGGNVGIQSSTIITRGFATGRVDDENINKVFLKELLVGVTMGLACGLLVAGVAWVWQGDPILGVVVGLAMVSSMTAATTIGTLAPATFKRLNIDPAIAAGPFVTTAVDLTGIVIYLGTATLFLELLVHG
ncbi:MAG: magnesium transporter [Deltaproteobacteria bacterium]|nr:magnesium transporter [Deltaproteobacteria bacterium]